MQRPCSEEQMRGERFSLDLGLRHEKTFSSIVQDHDPWGFTINQRKTCTRISMLYRAINSRLPKTHFHLNACDGKSRDALAIFGLTWMQRQFLRVDYPETVHTDLVFKCSLPAYENQATLFLKPKPFTVFFKCCHPLAFLPFLAPYSSNSPIPWLWMLIFTGLKIFQFSPHNFVLGLPIWLKLTMQGKARTECRSYRSL